MLFFVLYLAFSVVGEPSWPDVALFFTNCHSDNSSYRRAMEISYCILILLASTVVFFFVCVSIGLILKVEAERTCSSRIYNLTETSLAVDFFLSKSARKRRGTLCERFLL